MKTVRAIMLLLSLLTFLTAFALSWMFIMTYWEGGIMETVLFNYTDFFPFLILWVLGLILLTIRSMLYEKERR